MARSSVVPDLLDALLSTFAPLVPKFTVSDGFPVESNSGDYLAVGVDDPASTAPAPSARSDIEWAGASRAVGLNETGEVTCAIWARRGESDTSTARDAVYDALSAIQGSLRDPSALAVDGLWSTWLASTQLSQDQTPDGVLVLLVFRVGFKARL